jgi:transcriptional regulator
MSVHVRGKLSFLDEKGLIEVLRKTTLHFEGGDHGSPTAFDNLPADYNERLMKAIVAFEVEVESIENVFKLSQNRDQKSYQNIISRLSNQDNDSKKIADEMKKREEELFKGNI